MLFFQNKCNIKKDILMTQLFCALNRTETQVSFSILPNFR